MKEIMKYEMKKILSNKTFIGAMIVSLFALAGILFIGFYYSQVNISVQKKGDGLELYHQVVRNSTGEFTDQKVREILADYIDRFQSTNVNNRTFDLFSWEIADTFFKKERDIYTEMNEVRERGDKITLDQINVKTIKEIGFTEFETPLKIGSFVTWKDLFKVTNHLFILTSIITILVCCLVFSSDTTRNLNQLLLSTKFGRNKLTLSKIMTATLLSVAIFFFIQVISLGVFYVYNSGFTGWDTSIQTNFSLELFRLPVEINQGQVFLLALALHFTGLLSIIGITLFVSSITSSPFSSLALSLVLFILPAAFTQLIRRGIVYKFLNLFPINNYSIEDFLTLMSTKQEFLLKSFAHNIILTIIVLLAIKIALEFIVYRRMKQYQVA